MGNVPFRLRQYTGGGVVLRVKLSLLQKVAPAAHRRHGALARRRLAGKYGGKKINGFGCRRAAGVTPNVFLQEAHFIRALMKGTDVLFPSALMPFFAVHGNEAVIDAGRD